MKVLAVFIGALSCAVSMVCGAADGPPKPGDVVYQKTFDQQGWKSVTPPGCARLVPDGKVGSCLEVGAYGEGTSGAIGNQDVLGIVDKSKSSTYLTTTNFPADFRDRLKGYELEIEVGVKAEHVPVPPKPWEGIRISADFATSTKRYGQSYNGLSGTFGWRNVSYRVRLPVELKDMNMSLGLVSPSGKVYFDHVKLTVVDLPFAMKTPPRGAVFKGHELPRLRGFAAGGISDPGSENGRKRLDEIAKDWKANVAKLWFNLKGDFTSVDVSLGKWLDSVDASLATAKADRLYLILHVSAGWSRDNNDLFYEEPAYGDKFVEVWKTIAKRFKGSKEIYAFELLNESHLRRSVAPGCPDYPELMERAAQAINAIDPERAIIVQTEEWWGTCAFNKMRPLKARNIIYALHFYSPFPVSHQGIGDWYAGKTSWVAQAYPGTIDGVKWDKAALRRDLQVVRDFQRAYNCHIIVSEFSCVRWALGDSRRKLIKDMIDLYEEYGWDWLYHSYPDFTGWMPDEGCDPWNGHNPDAPSTVEPILRDWFAKNQRPDFEPRGFWGLTW